MPILIRSLSIFLLFTGVFLTGCNLSRKLDSWRAPVEASNSSIAPFMELASRQRPRPTPLSTRSVEQPATIKDLQNAPRWFLSIEEAIQLALASDHVVRSLGGQIVSQPDRAVAAIDPALIQTNAVAGEQAALSAFDALLRSNLQWTRADRGLKTQVLLSNATAIDSLFASSNTVIEKRNRHGTTFGFRTTLDYDRDNLGIPPNRFASAYDNSVGLEVRHPLALGGGKEFNEIAGPGARAGEYRGIIVAQINTNIAVHDFRVALRDHIHDVMRTYWGLYLSYADLDAKQESLEVARETLRIAKQKQEQGLVDVDQVYQAQERFYAAEAAYLDAVSGAPNRSILGILGVSGSQIAGVEVGVLALERRLRFQLGLPPSDGRLIRPVDTPSPAKMVFDWEQAVATAVTKRPELMRQAQVVHKKRMELKAAKNFMLPRLDAIAQYRFRGFGDDYFQDSATDDGALAELFNGDLQEWVAGLEFEWPAGNRIGHEAVRNAQFGLARELGILEQQQHQISHELASTFAEVDRAFTVRETALARYEAAKRHRDAMSEKFSAGVPVDIETVLDAQRIAVEARAAFNVAQIDCEIAILKLNVAKATFFDQFDVVVRTDSMPVVPEPAKIQPVRETPMVQRDLTLENQINEPVVELQPASKTDRAVELELPKEIIVPVQPQPPQRHVIRQPLDEPTESPTDDSLEKRAEQPIVDPAEMPIVPPVREQMTQPPTMANGFVLPDQEQPTTRDSVDYGANQQIALPAPLESEFVPPAESDQSLNPFTNTPRSSIPNKNATPASQAFALPPVSRLPAATVPQMPSAPSSFSNSSLPTTPVRNHYSRPPMIPQRLPSTLTVPSGPSSWSNQSRSTSTRGDFSQPSNWSNGRSGSNGVNRNSYLGPSSW